MRPARSPIVAPALTLLAAVVDAVALAVALPDASAYGSLLAFAGLFVLTYAALTLGYGRVSRVRASTAQTAENEG